MLILKGKSMKSEIVSNLMQDGGSICYAYDNMPVVYGEYAFFVDKNECSLEDFFNEIYSDFTAVFQDDYCKYLIIYTNETENTLKKYIDWIEEHRIIFRCCQILITCRD
jgi:hypothetical protein